MRIFPLGENALTIEFANEISAEINDKVIRLADFLTCNKFEGFLEIVPAYSSLTVFYDFLTVRKTFPEFATAFSAVKNQIQKALNKLSEKTETHSRIIEIPVRFDRKYALDLDFVAENARISSAEVIEIFTSKVYRVFMLGFLPGFPYMGEVDEKIATPRKKNPRLFVPKGSVGIAGKQTGIYPLDSPGGWQIIGRTDIELFTPESENPTFFQAGDSVKFYSAH